jgi:hypothetical protein
MSLKTLIDVLGMTASLVRACRTEEPENKRDVRRTLDVRAMLEPLGGINGRGALKSMVGEMADWE